MASSPESYSYRPRTSNYGWESGMRSVLWTEFPHTQMFPINFQPFRRLCVMLGADITCGESQSRCILFITYVTHKDYTVGLATSFLQGSKEEWSLVRRHPSERNFGIQLAGNRPGVLTATSEIIQREFGGGGGVDFVDLNCGCPIDLVVQKGSGSACKYIRSSKSLLAC